MDILTGVLFAMPIAAVMIVGMVGRRYVQRMRDEMDYARRYVDDRLEEIEAAIAGTDVERTEQLPVIMPLTNAQRQRASAAERAGRHRKGAPETR